MTLDEFIEALRADAAAHPGAWRVTKNGELRRRDGRRVCCPITAVAGHGLIGDAECGIAASMGLGMFTAACIIVAADRHDGDPDEPDLRRRLLEAVGLA